MLRKSAFIPALMLAAFVVIFAHCSPAPPRAPITQAFPQIQRHPAVASTQNYGPGSGIPALNRGSVLRNINLQQDLIPRGRHGRKYYRPMRPRYITIHSTQNYSAGADRHALALKNGKLRSRKVHGGNRIGYLTWHYTVDDRVSIQHLPDNEQGEHADFDGPGNNSSIGIEMCEHRGSDLNATIERTAQLTAKLMIQHGIPIQNVVPHYHWPRAGRSPAHKNCPHFLLDNGKPGRKWRWFQAKVEMYRTALVQG